MSVKLSPIYIDAQLINGIPANGAKVFCYAAGSTTKQTTYTDSTGTVPQANPIILNSRGEPANPIWLTVGQSYKFVFTASTDSDPPASPIRTIDNVTGVNDASLTLDQWVASGITPTYVSATQFTLPGDQTSSFTVNRRIKATVTAGTVYGYISASAYTTLTTVTVVLDSGVLDSGLSAVQLGLLTSQNTSLPIVPDTIFKISGSVDTTKLWRVEVDGFTTATTRVGTPPDKDITFAGLIDIRSYLAGLNLSTAGSSATMSIAAGQCMDSTNVNGMTLAAISKTTSAWAVGTGNGGLDTGAIANSTWYYFYVIKRTDTNVVDVVFSLSSSAPTLPTNYTLYRYIGAGFTNGSAQWTAFTQAGDEFFWAVPIADVNGAGSTSAVTTTISVPRGRKMKGLFSVSVTGAGGAAYATYLSDLSNTDSAPSGNLFSTMVTEGLTGTIAAGSSASVWTNTSAQIRHRETAGVTTLVILTNGWVDYRGRFD